jgi:hypothetical protein
MRRRMGLAHDECGDPHRTAEQAMPEVVGARETVGEGDRLHRAILQAVIAQEGVEILVSREAEEVGTRR